MNHEQNLPLSARSVIASVDPELAGDWPAVLSDAQVERLIVRAIHAGRLAEVGRSIGVLGPEAVAVKGMALAQRALAACEAITKYCLSRQSHILDRLAGKGVAATACKSSDNTATKQFHSFDLAVDPDDLDRVLALAGDEGYFPWGLWRPDKVPLMRRTRSTLTLIKTDEVATRMVLRWGKERCWER